jgi:hypothetical protein
VQQVRCYGADARIPGPKRIHQRQHLGESWSAGSRFGRGGVQRDERLPPNTAARIRPYRRQLVRSRDDAADERLGGPSCGDPRNDLAEPGGRDEATSTYDKLLEVRTVHATALRRIETDLCGTSERTMDERVIDVEIRRE